jgi:hypothetical protein
MDFVLGIGDSFYRQNLGQKINFILFILTSYPFVFLKIKGENLQNFVKSFLEKLNLSINFLLSLERE